MPATYLFPSIEGFSKSLMWHSLVHIIMQTILTSFTYAVRLGSLAVACDHFIHTNKALVFQNVFSHYEFQELSQRLTQEITRLI